jgi:hypothetical protein
MVKKKKKRIIFGAEDPVPEDLPEVKDAPKAKSVLQASRVCEKCGGISIRINSTQEERRAWCNGCGHNWAISMATSAFVPDGMLERGLHKRTLVEPDWSLAFEDLDGAVEED